MQKGEVQERCSARRVKCKKGEVQDRLRKDREGGLRRKHALECLRHGADLSAYGKFRTVPSRWVRNATKKYSHQCGCANRI